VPLPSLYVAALGNKKHNCGANNHHGSTGSRCDVETHGHIHFSLGTYRVKEMVSISRSVQRSRARSPNTTRSVCRRNGRRCCSNGCYAPWCAEGAYGAERLRGLAPVSPPPRPPAAHVGGSLATSPLVAVLFFLHYAPFFYTVFCFSSILFSSFRFLSLSGGGVLRVFETRC